MFDDIIEMLKHIASTECKNGSRHAAVLLDGRNKKLSIATNYENYHAEARCLGNIKRFRKEV